MIFPRASRDTVGTFNMAIPDKIFMSVLAAKHGVGLNDIDWRVYPPDLLGVALRKGKIQAFLTFESAR